MHVFVAGAGATGGLLSQILRRRGHAVVCGDRDPERARAFIGPHIECRTMDASDEESIIRIAQGCDLLVNAAPAVFNETMLRAALRLKVHYLDMAAHLDSDPFKAEQLKFNEAFSDRQRTALIVAGAAPGLTNLLVARCAEDLDKVGGVQIRLFEETESRAPVSMWSAEVAFDEAISKPRVYRAGRFRFARRFSQPELFRFPAPVGIARVVLAAQDEVATLPYFVKLHSLDVKIGGNEIDRLRRWQRQGRLFPSSEMDKARFPRTASPGEIADLVRRGRLSNARFSACVVVAGRKGGRRVEHRRCCTFPSLYKLRQKGWLVSPVVFAAAQSAAVFVEHFPKDLEGVFPPEALPREARRAVLRAMSRRGFRFHETTTEIERAGQAKRKTR